MVSSNVKLLSSIIGGLIYNCGIGSIFPLGNFSIYIISYHMHSNESLSTNYSFFMVPLLSFALTCFVSIGGLIESKVGVHIAMLIGSTVILLGNTLLYFSEHILLTYLSMIIFGIGFGFALFAPVKNACFYYPEKKGLISAVISSLGHIAGAGYNLIGETLINKENYTLQKDEVKYPFEIAKNVKRYYRFIFLTVPIGTIFGLLLTFQYKKKKNLSFISKKEEKGQYKKDLKRIIKSKRVWTLSLVCWLGTFLLFLLLNTFKAIGATAPKRVDAALLKYTAVFVGFSLSLSSPLWGIMIDKISFRVLFSIINVIGMFVGVAIVLGIYYLPIMFCVTVCVNALCVSGVRTILNPHVMKIFGIKYSMIVYGIIGLVSGSSNFMGSLFSFVVSSVFKNNMNFAYGCIFIFGSVLNFFSLILTQFEKDDVFEFTTENFETTIGGNDVDVNPIRFSNSTSFGDEEAPKPLAQ